MIYKWIKDNKGICCLVAIIVIFTTYWFIQLRYMPNDDAYITYRYAQNLINGRGFVFNPGERVLGTTAPFHGLVLAFMGLFYSNIPRDALILSWSSVIGMGVIILFVMKSIGKIWAGLISALFVIFSPFTYSIYALETLFLCFLLMGAFAAYFFKQNWLLAVFGALAVLTRNDSVFLLIPIYVALFLEGNKLSTMIRTGVVSILLTLPWFIFAWFYFDGSILSNTAATKTGWIGHEWYYLSYLWERGLSGIFPSNSLSILGVGLSGFGVVICFINNNYARFRVLIFWAIMQIAGYTIMRIFWPHIWYYYPVLLVAIIFSGIGLVEISKFFVYLYEKLGFEDLKISASVVIPALFTSFVISILMLMSTANFKMKENTYTAFFGGLRDRLYKNVSSWLVSNPEFCSTVGVYEPGTMAYYSDRFMIDMMGLVTLDVGDKMKQDNVREAPISWIVENYNPQCLIWIGTVSLQQPNYLQDDPDYKLIYSEPFEDTENHILVYSR